MNDTTAGLNRALEHTKNGRLQEALATLTNLGGGADGGQPQGAGGSYIPEIGRKHIPPAVMKIIDRWGPGGVAAPAGSFATTDLHPDQAAATALGGELRPG